MITSVIAVVVSQLVGGIVGGIMDMTTFVLVLSVVALVVVAIVGVNWFLRRHRFDLRDWAWSHGHAGQE